LISSFWGEWQDKGEKEWEGGKLAYDLMSLQKSLGLSRRVERGCRVLQKGQSLNWLSERIWVASIDVSCMIKAKLW
jgi:hypothetical protein